MFKLAVVGTVAAYVAAKVHPINEDIVKEIKAKATTWTAHEVNENPLRHHTVESLQGLLGDHGMAFGAPMGNYKSFESNSATPDNFDSRVAFADCVHPIRDQQRCGSCWAFGSSEAFSDSFCIASKGKINVVLSPEDLVSCDHSNSGCQGGWIGSAYEYFESTGIVADTCFPYTAGQGVEPACAKKCVTSDPFTKYQCAPNSIVHLDKPELIKAALVAGGPMATRFDVFQDFMSYKGGIYQHVTGSRTGGHAVKVVGYGVEGGVNYWIIANSWNTAWGENGYFRIAFNQCGINDNVFTCTPLLPKSISDNQTTQEDELDLKIVTMKSTKIPAAIGPYTAGKEITANGSILAYSSGQIGLTSAGVLVAGDVVSQAEQALTNIKNLAQDNGLTLADAIKTTVYLTDMNDFDAVNAVYATYFTSNFPARTCVQVAALPKGAKVEVEAVFFKV